MATAFFDAILPDRGVYFAAVRQVGSDGRPFWRHVAAASSAELAAAVTAIDARGRDVYFALASYRAPECWVTAKDGTRKRKRRTQSNVEAVRALWLDLDCGPTKAYPDQPAALRTVFAACGEAEDQLPVPTYVVSSGRGIHVYWAFDRALPLEIWTKLATVFKACIGSLGVASDAQVIANAACVLRPPGTHNYKDPKDPRPVTLLNHHGPTYTPRDMARRLLALAESRGVDTTQPARRSPDRALATTSPFATGLDTQYPVAYAMKIADHCRVLGAMRDTLGANQTYPEWLLTLCLLINTEEGASDDELLHAWSAGHSGYDAAAAQAKFDDLRERAKPPLCATFAEHTADTCHACPHWGQIKSPIVLGYRVEGHDAQPEQRDETGTVVQAAIPDFPLRFRQKFRWNAERRRLEGRKRVKLLVNGVLTEQEQWCGFCSFFFHVAFLWMDTTQHEQAFYARVEVQVRPDRIESHDIPFSAIAKGGSQLHGVLGQHLGIVPTTHPDLLERYVRTWCDSLRQDTDLSNIRRAMGWQSDGSFLLGNRLYQPDGTVVPALVPKEIARSAMDYEPRGDLATYVKGIDTLYNRPDRVPHQLLWMAAFASIFVALYDAQPIGLLLTAVSAKSGTGKTSAALAGLSVWANPYATAQNVSAEGATDYAFITLAGQRRHLPLLFDETTGWLAEKVASFAYRYSQGVPKMQGRAEGGVREVGHLSWQNILLMTSNTTPSTKVLSRHANAAPMIARLFEVQFPGVDLNAEDPGSAEVLRGLLRAHHGVAGDAFLRRIVPEDKEKIREQVKALVAKLTAEVQADSSARFWVQMGACQLAAFAWTRALGLHAFDPKAFKAGVVKAIRGMQATVQESQHSLEDVFGAMLSDLAPGLVITRVAGKRAPDPNNILSGIHYRKITGRVIMTGKEAGIYIPVSVVRAWCAENQHDVATLRDAARAAKILTDPSRRFNLGVGTYLPVGRMQTWMLDYDALHEQVQVHAAGSPQRTYHFGGNVRPIREMGTSPDGSTRADDGSDGVSPDIQTDAVGVGEAAYAE